MNQLLNKTAPEFSTSDSKGRKINISDYKGSKNVMLVFNRGFM